MSQIIRIKNNTAIEETWAGQSVPAGAYYDLQTNEVSAWVNDDTVFVAVGNGDIIVNKGGDNIDDIIDVTEAWKWMVGDTMPLSDLGNKLAIHSSTKPAPPGSKEFYLVWTGAGDDVVSTTHAIGEGPMLQFTSTVGAAKESIEVHFSPDFGDVYVHEGYAKWENGGTGDFLEADIIATATPLQTAANLDLVIADNWITYAPGGAGTGTHGFAASPVLIKRSKSMDGNWDYDGTNLTPNMSSTGLYKISDIERAVHHYFNKIPTRGSSYGYTNLTSDESAWMPPGYFIRITANNISDTVWNACIFMEVFREQTAVP